MILVPFFAISTDFESTKNLLGFPFQAPVIFGFYQLPKRNLEQMIYYLKILIKGFENQKRN